MKRTLILPILTAIVTVGIAAPAYAREGTDDTSSGTGTVVKTTESTDTTTTTKTDDTNTSSTELRDRIEARKTELEDKLKQKLDDRKEKLEGRRLARCQNRETAINNLIDKSAALGKERLARIQAIENGVKAFYEKQQLSSTEYDAALQAADEKQAAAVAALEVVDTETFSCDQVDGANPSDTIKTTNVAKRTALKDYRDSVQQLIKVVRQAFVDKVQATEGKQ